LRRLQRRGVLAGRIFFDRATMDRESLRTGLERCIGNRTRDPFCMVSARGKVRIELTGFATLENATLVFMAPN
jgi:hypothetical protein